METAPGKGFLDAQNNKKEGVGGSSKKKGDANKEGQVVSDKRGRSSTGNKGKDLCQRAWEEFDRSNKRPEAVPSNYEIEVHRSMASIPKEVLEDAEKKNQGILEASDDYKKLQVPHLVASQREILQTAELALGRVPEGQSKRALLLGIGNALDIPLRKLAEKFDHLTVVEWDRTSAEKAIKKLSPDLQAKIKLVVADLSGVTGELCNRIQADKSDSQTAFFENAIKAIKDTKKKVTESVPNFGSDYAFVCSQLVLTQLSVRSHFYIHEVANSKYAKLNDKSQKYKNFQQEFDNLAQHVEQAHIDFLAKSVIPQGTVHFADTYINSDYGAMFSGYKVNEAISARFKEKQTEWDFDQHPNLNFGVVSYRLEPKSEE